MKEGLESKKEVRMNPSLDNEAANDVLIRVWIELRQNEVGGLEKLMNEGVAHKSLPVAHRVHVNSHAVVRTNGHYFTVVRSSKRRTQRNAKGRR